MSKAKRHVVFLTEGEIISAITHCKAGIKMAEQGSSFFEKLRPDLESTLAKLEEKAREFQ